MLEKYFNFFSKHIFLMVFFLPSSGCVSIPKFASLDVESTYQVATEKYARYMRWGYIKDAAGFSRAKDGSNISHDLNDARKYRVSNYKILNRMLSDNGFEGRVLAIVEYYHIDSGVLRHLELEQSWWFDHLNRRWYLSGPLPRFSDGLGDE